MRRPLTGLTVCRRHGGGTQAAQKKSLVAKMDIEARKQMERAVAVLGIKRDGLGPAEALMEEVQWTAAHVEYLRGMVQELDEQDLVWGTTATEEASGVGPKGPIDEKRVRQEATPSVWYRLYMEERKHLVRTCAEALRAGVEERKVRLAEQQGEQVAAVINRSLQGILRILIERGMFTSVDDARAAWWVIVQDVVPAELRKLEAA